MNYQIIYDKIILKAKNQLRVKLNKDASDFIYYENHHILPKCLGGTNDKSNLVLLTAREHFICHKLLVEIYPKNNKLIHAVHKMMFSKTEHQDRNYRIGANEYARFRLAYSKIMSERELSKETRNKIRETRIKNEIGKGEDHPLYGVSIFGEYAPTYGRGGEKGGFYGKKHTEEHKRYVSKIHKGKVLSQETKGKMSKAREGKFLGENNHMYGKKHTDEAKRKVSEANAGKKRTEEQKKKAKENRTYLTCPHCGKTEVKSKAIQYHFDKCKSNPTYVPKEMPKCPHCGYQHTNSYLNKYHRDNCRKRKT